MNIKKFVLLFFILMIGSCKSSQKEIQPSQIQSPQMGDLAIKILSTGSIVPFHRIELKPSDKGRVEKVFFDEGQFVKENTVLALISTMDRIALIDSAKANLLKANQWGNKEVIENAKEELKTAESAYNPIPIFAPVSGEIIKRDIQVGEYVTADKAIFVLSDRLILKLEVNEADIGKIKPGQNLSFYLDAFPEESSRAVIQQISREGKVVSSIMKYEVIAFPQKIDKKWIAGMTVNAEFTFSEKRNVLLLPLDAVKKFKNRTFVVLIKGKSKEVREITTGADDFKNVEILSGITKDDEVVVLNQKDFMEIMKPVQKNLFSNKGKSIF